MADLKEILFRAENEELTEAQLKMICNAPIVSYHQLASVSSLDQILSKDKEAIILYETSQQDVGHWTAIWENEAGIQFFDPYGFHPDQELRWNRMNTTPYLTNLISKSGKPLHWNTEDLQQWKAHVNTCGRHTAMRLRWKRLNHQQYAHIIKSLAPELSADNVVTMLTYVSLDDDRHLVFG